MIYKTSPPVNSPSASPNKGKMLPKYGLTAMPFAKCEEFINA
jgi:hypothetical protein